MRWQNNCLWVLWTLGLNVWSLLLLSDLEEEMDKLLLQTTQKLTLCLSVKRQSPISPMNNYSRTMEQNFQIRKMQKHILVCFLNTKKQFRSYKMLLSGKIYKMPKIQMRKFRLQSHWMRNLKTIQENFLLKIRNNIWIQLKESIKTKGINGMQ